jgi:hypothetical protein
MKPGGVLSKLRANSGGINTFVTYLHALQAFADYRIYENRDAESATQLLVRIKYWLRGVSKDKARRRVQIRESATETSKRLVIPAVLRFAESEFAADAITLLDAAVVDAASDVSRADYLLMRDYLVIATLISNGHRSGVLRNMLSTELAGASEQSEERYIVNVADHKTEMQSVARVVFSAPLWRHYEHVGRTVSPEAGI